MLFILFDIETIFLFPVAINLKAFGAFALWETIVFIVLLIVAFVYVWRRGAREWKSPGGRWAPAATATSARASSTRGRCCAASSTARTSTPTSRSACGR